MRPRKPKCGLAHPDLALAFYNSLPENAKLAIRMDNIVRATQRRIMDDMMRGTRMLAQVANIKIVGLEAQCRRILDRVINPPMVVPYE